MWKKQGTTPKYQTLKKLEKYFGCDLTDLVSPEEGAQAIIEHIAVKAKSETPIERVTHDMVQMTDEGQSKVVGYVEDILPRYRRQDAPQTPPASSEGTDTTPPPDAPETPPEGE